MRHPKAKKLLTLAQTGVQGERENAQKLLEKYTRKHNISYKDIVGEDEKSCFTIYSGRQWHEWLLDTFVCQIISSIKGGIKIYKSRNMSETFVWSGTPEEEELIQRKLEHHKRQLGKIIQNACMKYITDENLYVNDAKFSIDGGALPQRNLEPVKNLMLLHKIKP